MLESVSARERQVQMRRQGRRYGAAAPFDDDHVVSFDHVVEHAVGLAPGRLRRPAIIT